MNRLFVLPFSDLTDRTRQSRYYLLSEKMKEYNVVTNGKNFSDQIIKNDIKTYENIWKITTGPADGCTTG